MSNIKRSYVFIIHLSIDSNSRLMKVSLQCPVAMRSSQGGFVTEYPSLPSLPILHCTLGCSSEAVSKLHIYFGRVSVITSTPLLP